MKKYLLGIVMMLITAIAFALPSPRDVENSMAQGNFSEAQSMTAEVLREHPESARAHLLNAYLLIHVNHDKTAANAELNTASGLDRKGDVKNSSLFGRTVAEIDLQKATAPPPRAQQQIATVQPSGPITYQQPNESGGHGFLIFLVVVGAVAVIIVLFIRGANNKAQRIDHSDIPRGGYTPLLSNPDSRIQIANTQPAPLYPSYPQQPIIIQQPVTQGSQGLGFGGQMAATAGGVIAGEAIVSTFRHRSSGPTWPDDDYEERRRRERAYDSTPAYTPDPYVAPVRESSPVSSSNERSSYSSGSDNSWSSGSSSSSSSDYSSSSSDSSSSWSDTSSSSSSSDSW